ncbi:DUF2924 domain-containing protein [Sphingomonas bacterium]|uniref:DUF2924 domain-containing protein n=1 Tax=Sphingomonas bacterium TaxID=1895847 RepID=UPI0015754A3B|nr:DUF2924 domain-containing protein [Sphingomonas bacterium]
MSALDQRLAALPGMSSAALREAWVRATGTAAPRVSPGLLRLALAWELQAAALGSLPRGVTAALDQLERGQTTTRAPAAGMRLVREWGGKVHVVEIGEDQVIRWDGRDWRSLSEVARAITGTRWSGPAFFGLKRKVAA